MLRIMTFVSILALAHSAVFADDIVALRRNCIACCGASTPAPVPPSSGPAQEVPASKNFPHWTVPHKLRVRPVS